MGRQQEDSRRTDFRRRRKELVILSVIPLDISIQIHMMFSWISLD